VNLAKRGFKVKETLLFSPFLPNSLLARFKLKRESIRKKELSLLLIICYY